jgi:hypothetical protein
LRSDGRPGRSAIIKNAAINTSEQSKHQVDHLYRRILKSWFEMLPIISLLAFKFARMLC